MPHELITEEKGPKGTRCVTRLYWTGTNPYERLRTWRSSWFNTGNEQRDFYLGRMELQKRFSEAFKAGKFPR